MKHFSLWASLSLLLALVGLGSLVAPQAQSASTGSFYGRILDIATGEPIAGAQVEAADQRATTDALGNYELICEAGLQRISVRAPGYIGMSKTRQRLVAGDKVELDFEMVPRQPSVEEAEIIDRKMRELAQALPDDLDRATLQRGFAPSQVHQVPSSLRILMPDGSVVIMSMDEYLKGVVPHEMPPYWPMEALRAQAVAARSYAATRHAHAEAGADICTTVHCQVWGATHYETTDQAVESTHGVAATYEGQIIYAYFFGHCDGHTRDSEQVWGGYLPYCRSVACPCGFDFMWGHGVGMCQEGARALAQGGYGYVEILKHYYTGISSTTARPGYVADAWLQPLSGDTHTEFVYEAIYISEIGDLPVAAHVIIDGRAHALDRIATESGGWRYRTTVQLPAGEHTHRFYFDDGYGHLSFWPDADTAPGPSVTAPDPSAPTPTPLPPIPKGIRSLSDLTSTSADWAMGTSSGVQSLEIGDGALTLAPGNTSGVYESPVITSPWPFTALGALWYAQVPGGASVELALRTSSDGTTWEAWRPWALSEDGPSLRNVHVATLLPGVGTAMRYRLTLRATDPDDQPIIEEMRAVLIDSADALASPQGGQSPGPSASSAHTSEAASVISRATWGADETIMIWPPIYRQPQAIILHHTGAAQNGVDSAAIVRALYYYDTVVSQRGDVGYNFIVDEEGAVYQGRSGGAGVVGAHAGRFDWGSIGIALIGDGTQQTLTPEALDRLAEFLAARCVEHFIDPAEQEHVFIDEILPTLMAHSDCEETVCPGDLLQALLPDLRTQVLDKMADVPPHIALVAPAEMGLVRGAVEPLLQASAVITRVAYYVDDTLAGTDERLPGSWRWNTCAEADGAHRLRIVASNAAGWDADERNVLVDNLPPNGQVSAPAWSNSTRIALDIQSEDASRIQFSNNWVWEGEELLHAVDSGQMEMDEDALNGQTWHGRGGIDTPGGWFGPYTCSLPSWSDYQISFRLKTDDVAPALGLATLDVVDDQGRRKYAERPLSARDFCTGDTYEEILLDLPYGSRSPTCDDPDISDGLEFRVWFSAAGDLFWDRVTAFSAPQPIGSSVDWTLRSTQGLQRVQVRLLDAAGNLQDHELTVGLDGTAPEWVAGDPGLACVHDALAGLDPASGLWSYSADDATTWSAWASLGLGAAPGTTSLCWSLPSAPGTHVRFRIADQAGNASTSAAYALGETTPGTPTPSPTATPSCTATLTPSATPMTMTPTPTASSSASPAPELNLPLILAAS